MYAYCHVLVSGTVILDLEAEVLPEISKRIVEQLIEDRQIDDYNSTTVKWAIELRHSYMREGSTLNLLKKSSDKNK